MNLRDYILSSLGMKGSKCSMTLIGSIAGLALAAGMAGSSDAQERLTWSGTGSTSANQVWGIQAADVMSQHSGVRVIITDSPGSSANVERIRQNSAQLGHVTTDVAYKAMKGIGSYEGNAYEGIRTLLMVKLLPLFFGVTQESGVMSLEDLDGRPFSPGPPGFATSQLAINELEALDIQPNFFVGTVGEAVNGIKDGNLVGIVRAGGVPDANLSEIAATKPIRLIGPTPEQVEKLREEIPTALAITVTIPGGTYSGMPDTIEYTQIGFGLLVGSSPQVSQDVGYRVVKSVLEHWDEGFGKLAAFKDTNPQGMMEMTIEYASVPLHAGTVQYLKEAGVDVPANLIPPEFKE